MKHTCSIPGPWLVTLAWLVCGCAHAPATAPQPPLQLFEFRSNPWVNLHHALYGAGLLAAGKPLLSGGGAVEVTRISGVDPAVLTAEQRAVWDAAVAYYSAHVSPRDLSFDGGLEDLNNALSALDGSAEKAGPSIPADVAVHLDAAMPIYRAQFWPQHHQANQAWMEGVKPLLEQHGQEVARDLSRIYARAWPREPFRVDVSCYAGWGGAYSTLNPVTHVVVSSGDGRNAGMVGFETLFHESSHALVRPVRDVLGRQLEAQGKSAGSLWHAVLFYSVGEAVKRRVPSHVPYADQYGLYDSGDWKLWRPLMQQHWAPYVEGRVPLEDAARNLVGAL